MMKNKIFYVIINYMSQGSNILLNVLMMRMLSPSELGLLSLAKILFQSAEYSHLGSRFALDRMLPSSDKFESLALLNSAIFFCTIFGLGYIFVCYLYFGNESIYILFSIAGLFFVLANFFKVYSRAKSNYFHLNVVTTVLVFFPILIQIIQLISGGYHGFVHSFFYGYLISFVFIILLNRGLLLKIDPKKFFLVYKNKLAKPGFLLLISSFISFMAMTFDRIIVGVFFSLDFLGYYSILLFFISLYLIMPAVISELALPDIMKFSNGNNIFVVIKKYAIVTFLSSIFISIGVFCLFDLIINIIDPKYVFLKNEVFLALLILIPYTFTPFVIHYFNAIDKQFFLMIINLLAFIIYISFLLLYINFYSDVNLLGLVFIKVLYFFIQFLLLALFIFISRKRYGL
ncbi:hypothetical protein [Pectobacterium punjabense]|uniref:hypothetical protein n=1 Tax=Pectobacterium punjabense TaxID=2108399 RepID=UPI003D9B992A